jgi:hypothetical protein
VYASTTGSDLHVTSMKVLVILLVVLKIIYMLGVTTGLSITHQLSRPIATFYTCVADHYHKTAIHVSKTHSVTNLVNVSVYQTTTHKATAKDTLENVIQHV